MILSNTNFQRWLEQKANLNYVQSGYVVGFDYEWYISADLEEVEKEHGTYYKSSDMISTYELWIDIRQKKHDSQIEKVFIILQNIHNKENLIIKEFTPEYIEENLVDKTIEQFINTSMVQYSLI